MIYDETLKVRVVIDPSQANKDIQSLGGSSTQRVAGSQGVTSGEVAGGAVLAALTVKEIEQTKKGNDLLKEISTSLQKPLNFSEMLAGADKSARAGRGVSNIKTFWHRFLHPLDYQKRAGKNADSQWTNFKALTASAYGNAKHKLNELTATHVAGVKFNAYGPQSGYSGKSYPLIGAANKAQALYSGLGKTISGVSSFIGKTIGVLAGVAKGITVGAAVITAGVALATVAIKKFAAMMNQFVQQFGQYNAAVGAAEARYIAHQTLFDVRMGQVLEPMLLAWINIKDTLLTVLEKMGPKLVPLVNVITGWLQAFADKLPTIIAALTDFTGYVFDLASYITSWIPGFSGISNGLKTLAQSLHKAGWAALGLDQNGQPLQKNNQPSKFMGGYQADATGELFWLMKKNADRGQNNKDKQDETQKPKQNQGGAQSISYAVPSSFSDYIGGLKNGSGFMNVGAKEDRADYEKWETENGKKNQARWEKRGFPKEAPKPKNNLTDKPAPTTKMQSLPLQFSYNQSISYDMANMEDLHASRRDMERRLFNSMNTAINESELLNMVNGSYALYSDRSL